MEKEEYICSICGKPIPKLTSLCRRERKEEYICSICGKPIPKLTSLCRREQNCGAKLEKIMGDKISGMYRFMQKDQFNHQVHLFNKKFTFVLLSFFLMKRGNIKNNAKTG
jgi:DNA-directed RNA polymerase subunit RPC12/RpoP